MTRLNVNPTRMELKKLKSRLSTAVRGHKLLKDKSDEMIRRFTVLVRENKRLQDEVSAGLRDCLNQFNMVKSFMDSCELEKAFSMPVNNIVAEYGIKDIMSVDVPSITVTEKSGGGKYPYAFSEITSEADYSVQKVSGLITKLIKLAEVEKAVQMLSLEIERNKRRVNALEYIMIPQIEETIKYIKSKLDENERSATTRLMKVKSMLNGKN